MASFNNLASLQRWFMDNGRGDNPAPYWTLYAGDYGTKETILKFNDRITDMGESFDLLQRTIQDMNNPMGVRFRVFQTDRPRHNVAVAQTYVQIFSPAGAGAVAGINGMGEAAVDIDRKIQEAVSTAQKEWAYKQEIAELKAQLNAPPSTVGDKLVAMIERIADSPIGPMLIARFTGMDPAQVQAIAAPPEQQQPLNEMNADDDRLNDDLDAIESALGTDAGVLVAKIRRFVETDPATAKNLLNAL